MNWFIAGVAVHSCGILLVAGNAWIDYTSRSSSDNTVLNLLGLAMMVILAIAFSLKNAGMLSAANVLLWIPGFPMVLVLLFFILYLVISWLSGGGWQ